MTLRKIVNSVIGTEYLESPVEEQEKTASQIIKVSNDPYDEIMGVLGEMDNSDYEFNQIEKLATAAYLLEKTGAEEDDRGLFDKAKGFAKSPTGKGMAIGLILGWLAKSILSPPVSRTYPLESRYR